MRIERTRCGRSLATLLSVVALAVLSSSVRAQGAGEGPVLRREALGATSLYLYRDKAGSPYALRASGDPVESDQGRRYVSEVELQALQRAGVSIGYLTEHPDGAVGACSQGVLPANFNIVQIDDVVYGNVAACSSNARPPGTNTQVIEFQLFTSNYEGQAAHAPVIPWFKNDAHGHGLYFGDTSLHPCLDGRPARFNTRIEGWSQWFGKQQRPAGLPPDDRYDADLHERWTSTGPYLAETCGEELEDGWDLVRGEVRTLYRVRIHASERQWVQYQVDRWTETGWVRHTAEVVRDVTYAHWANGPGLFDPAATGLFIGSTGPLGEPRGGSWAIGIRNLRVEWIDASEAHQALAVVEYYHRQREHYFVTADPHEIAALDAGAFAGWVRTGQSFLARPPVSEKTGVAPVCRFYGGPESGLDSHFYAAGTDACREAQRLLYRWRLEALRVFDVLQPTSAQGDCPARSIPIYRLWNGRSQSNHRYTTNRSLREGMVQRGWIAEGLGREGVVMCAVAPSAVGPN